MIPAFPEFNSLSIEMREEIERITSVFSPYSDFNFVSLWCWNLTNKTELSILNENLVVRMEDYTTAEIFYMFIGKNKIEGTLNDLLSFLKKEKIPQELYLLPEEMLSTHLEKLKQKYSIEEDRDNFDYIIDIESLSRMEGHELHQKRKLLNNFLKDKNPSVDVVTLKDPTIRKRVLDFFELWKKAKGNYDSKNEEIALNKLFDGLTSFTNIYILTAKLNNKLIGFSVFEILGNGYAIGDFQKGDISHKGVYEFLNLSIARFLKERKIQYYNIEQDLGIEGLRRAKLDYNPKFLKKFTLKTL